jgi:pyrimidine-nucleoside phosphorylase
MSPSEKHAPSPVELLVTKRDGKRHRPGDITRLVESFMSKELADYQMSAWLMAAFHHPLTSAETQELTLAMLHSGTVLEHKGLKLPAVDKHSTGGVGDKISIALAPLVAATGVPVPMISGRGLGHTGGTLDKLEAIPGFSVVQSEPQFCAQVRKLGVAMIGQTERLAPADRRIYALRDVTGTVESIPLIVASILSKKLAEGIDALVLDVKVGRGAFMKTLSDARRLARALETTARGAGKRVTSLITRMDAPLGLTIGNALETREAIEILHGKGPSDVRQLTLRLAREMLLLAGASSTVAAADKQVLRALSDGRALELFAKMVRAQGGDVRVVTDPKRLPRVKSPLVVNATCSGTVADIDAMVLGRASVALGAGRWRAEDKVDPRAGIELAVQIGDRVEKGDPLAWLHASKRVLCDPLVETVRGGFVIGSGKVKRQSLVVGS